MVYSYGSALKLSATTERELFFLNRLRPILPLRSNDSLEMALCIRLIERTKRWKKRHIN